MVILYDTFGAAIYGHKEKMRSRPESDLCNVDSSEKKQVTDEIQSKALCCMLVDKISGGFSLRK